MTVVKGVEVCCWLLDEIDGFWQTDCGRGFCLADGTPTENEMRFCCYCGKPLHEQVADSASAQRDG